MLDAIARELAFTTSIASSSRASVVKPVAGQRRPVGDDPSAVDAPRQVDPWHRNESPHPDRGSAHETAIAFSSRRDRRWHRSSDSPRPMAGAAPMAHDGLTIRIHQRAADPSHDDWAVWVRNMAPCLPGQHGIDRNLSHVVLAGDGLRRHP